MYDAQLARNANQAHPPKLSFLERDLSWTSDDPNPWWRGIFRQAGDSLTHSSTRTLASSRSFTISTNHSTFSCILSNPSL
jgi:hypothetical protein